MARISITVRLCCTGLAGSGIMLPMKYWESAADKLHRCWLVMGLLQCRDTTRLAMDR
jgi:hypothetical protein